MLVPRISAHERKQEATERRYDDVNDAQESPDNLPVELCEGDHQLLGCHRAHSYDGVTDRGWVEARQQEAEERPQLADAAAQEAADATENKQKPSLDSKVLF